LSVADMEQIVARVWCDELGISQVGMDDSFFDLGGHSVMLIRVHHRLVRELDQKFPIVTLFRYPTIRALAHHLFGGQELEDQGCILAERRRAGRRQLDSRRSLRKSPGPDLGK
jgi:acyl carrier protein